MALEEAERILSLDLNPDHKDFGLLLSRKVAITNAILTATARVTPGRLRGQEQNHMVEVIAAVVAEREKLRKIN